MKIITQSKATKALTVLMNNAKRDVRDAEIGLCPPLFEGMIPWDE